MLHDPDGTPMREVWRIRKLGEEIRPAGWFLANSRNWRVHPQAQRQALRGVLSDLGWLDSVKVNLRSAPEWGAEQGIPCLWDGHARIEESLKEGDDTAVPLEYYDLTPAEEAEALATFDPLSALAGTDAAQFDALLREVSTGEAAITAMLDGLAQRAGVVPFEPMEPGDLWKGMPEFQQDDIESWKRVIVHFANEGDYHAFARLVGQTLTPQTKYIWYPEQQEENLLAYQVEDES